jgi:hypothetical protein
VHSKLQPCYRVLLQQQQVGLHQVVACRTSVDGQRVTQGGRGLCVACSNHPRCFAGDQETRNPPPGTGMRGSM